MNSQMARGLIVGILIGAAIGITVGMLYAPHSGRITRGIIAERASQVKHDASRTFDDARYRGRRMVRDVRERIGK